MRLRGFAQESGTIAALKEALRRRSRQVVENGVLNGYFLSVYTARKLGMQVMWAPRT